MFRWIASYPKSGNTWLRMFLSAYIYGDLDINRPEGFLFDDLGHYVWQVVSPKPLDKLSPLEAVALRGAVLVHMREANGDQYLKTHSAIGSVSGFPAIPWALTDRAVYIVRDPRCVAVSMAHHLGETIDDIIETMALADHCFGKAPGLFNTMGTWSAHVTSWERAARFPVKIVRYEDISRETFGEIVDFLSLERKEDRIDRAMELTSFDALQAQENQNGFAERCEPELGPFFRRAARDWPELSEAQEAQIVTDHREVMERYGYL